MSVLQTGTGGRVELGRRESIILVVATVTAFTSQMAVPFWVGAVIDSFGLSAETAGTIAAVEFTMVAVVSYAIAYRIHRHSVRSLCTIGFALLILANGASAFMDSPGALTFFRAIAGAGKGLVISAAFGLAGRSTSPARAFALLNAGYTLFSAITLLAVPFAIKGYGASGAFAALCVATIVGACLLPWVPSHRAEEDSPAVATQEASSTSGVGGVLALLSLIVLVGASLVLWTFVERLGLRAGLSITEIGMVLSAAAVITLAGPVLAHWLDVRLGYLMPIVLGISIQLVISALLGWVASAAVFIAAVPLLHAAQLFAVPYLQALISLADPKGRFAAAAGASMTLGAAIGSYLGGVTVTHLGLSHVGTVAVAMLVLVVVLAFMAVRRLTSVEVLAAA